MQRRGEERAEERQWRRVVSCAVLCFPLHPAVPALRGKEKIVLARGEEPLFIFLFYTVKDNKAMVLGKTLQLPCGFRVVGLVRVSSQLLSRPPPAGQSPELPTWMFN